MMSYDGGARVADSRQGKGDQMLVCETIYGRARGAQLVELVERCTGEPCPCKQGLACPLMPSDSVEGEGCVRPPA